MDGYIQFESIISIPEIRPEIFSVGEFSIIDPISNKIIYFDFEDYYANIEYTNNNKLLINVELSNFNLDFSLYNTNFVSSSYVSEDRLNELYKAYNNSILDEIIVNGKIEEIFYECYGSYGEKFYIPLSINYFIIGDKYFPKESILEYNKKIIANLYIKSINELNKEFRNYTNKLKGEHEND